MRDDVVLIFNSPGEGEVKSLCVCEGELIYLRAMAKTLRLSSGASARVWANSTPGVAVPAGGSGVDIQQLVRVVLALARVSASIGRKLCARRAPKP